jgi:hypothetical protein
MIVTGWFSKAYGDDEETRAKAALSLAAKSREREHAKYLQAVAKNPCRTDWNEAEKEAITTGKAVVIWVGMKCCDNKELRLALPDAIHVHLDTMNGNSKARVVLAHPAKTDNALLIVEKEKINTTTGERFKAAYERSQAKPVPIPAPIVPTSNPWRVALPMPVLAPNCST